LFNGREANPETFIFRLISHHSAAEPQRLHKMTYSYSLIQNFASILPHKVIQEFSQGIAKMHA
jgi:hypothetical protein